VRIGVKSREDSKERGSILTLGGEVTFLKRERAIRGREPLSTK
jgi:hypothetical protein